MPIFQIVKAAKTSQPSPESFAMQLQSFIVFDSIPFLEQRTHPKLLSSSKGGPLVTKKVWRATTGTSTLMGHATHESNHRALPFSRRCRLMLAWRNKKPGDGRTSSTTRRVLPHRQSPAGPQPLSVFTKFLLVQSDQPARVINNNPLGANGGAGGTTRAQSSIWYLASLRYRVFRSIPSRRAALALFQAVFSSALQRVRASSSSAGGIESCSVRLPPAIRS